MREGPGSNPGAPAKIVIVEREPAAGPSVPPGSVSRWPRSLRPLAASLRPMRSLLPSAGGAADVSSRRRRTLAIAALVTLGVAAGIAGVTRSGVHGPLVREIVSGKAGVRTTPSGAKEVWGASGPSFVLDPSRDRMGDGAKGAVVDAFSTWDSAKLGVPRASFSISSTPGKAAQDGVSRIVYAPIEVEGKEDALALTISYADAVTGAIRETDVIFNAKHRFHVFPVASPEPSDTDAICNGDYDVQNVATHEAGHVYGLGEDTDDLTTTMYIRSSPCEIHKRTLSAPDTQVMTALYTGAGAAAATAPPGGASGGCGGATVAPSRERSRGAVAIGSAVVVGLAAMRRRRRRGRGSGRGRGRGRGMGE